MSTTISSPPFLSLLFEDRYDYLFVVKRLNDNESIKQFYSNSLFIYHDYLMLELDTFTLYTFLKINIIYDTNDL